MNRSHRWTWIVVSGFCWAAATDGEPVRAGGEASSPAVEIGKRIFLDTSLSHPPGQGCVSCHNPRAAFADVRPVSPGAVAGRAGRRNAPTLMYATMIPERTMEEVVKDGVEIPAWEGGLFHDGRARDVFEQVQGPIFDPNEMHVPDEAALAAGLRKADYADDLRHWIGEEAWKDDSRLTYHGYRALVEFLKEPMFRPFDARIDDYLAGDESVLSEAEKRGLAVFKDRGKCVDCHFLEEDLWPHPLLTDHGYDNLGAPSKGGKDPGLGAQTKRSEDLGLFRVPTLRNIGLTGPYMHNGSIATLREVVEFYNKRDVAPKRWGATDYPATVNHDDMGDLGLTDQEVDDLVALMAAFTDRSLLDMKPDAVFPEAPSDVPPTAQVRRYFYDWTHRIHPAHERERLVGESPDPVKPNVVIIYADDLGYGEVKALNPERCKIETPAMDSLAREGMVFTDGHSSSAVCTPSRYSLMTGRYSWRSKLQNSVLNPWGKNLLKDSRVTLPEVLRGNGYATAMIGKWHLGWDWQKEDDGYVFDQAVRGGPVDHGFDYYFGPDVPDFPPFAWIENDRLTVAPTIDSTPDPRGGRGGPMVPDWEPEAMLSTMAGKAADYFQKRAVDRKPFFLYFALTAPHTPIVPSDAFKEKSGMGAYCDFVMETDHTVGVVLKALENAGLAKNTLVLFSSDNGCSSGPSRSYDLAREFGHYTSAHLRGHKASSFEGGTRVPFMVRWPGVVAAGARCDQLVCQIDYMATIAELLGVSLSNETGVDSVSFLPLLKDSSGEPTRDRLILHNFYGQFSLRQGPHKLILAPGNGKGFGGGPSDADAIKRGDPMVQLYDLGKDPGETRNLALQQPERVKLMTEALISGVENGRTTEGAHRANDVPVDLYKRHLYEK